MTGRFALVLLVGCRWHFDARDDATPPPLGDAREAVDSAFTPTTDAPVNALTVWFGDCATGNIAGAAVDTSIDDTRPDQNFGRRDTMRVGNNRVSLVFFDIAALGASAQIFSANLEVSVSSSDALEAGYVAISPMLEDWIEGTGDFSPGVCNWVDRIAGVAWATVGAGAPGSRASNVMGTFTPSLENVRHDVALDAAIVQAWVTGANFGMALYGVAEGAQGAWLQTREATDPNARPCLRVTYVQ